MIDISRRPSLLAGMAPQSIAAQLGLGLGLLLAGTAAGAGSYDLVNFEHLTSKYQIYVGLPCDSLTGADSPRVAYRRKEIEKAIGEHLVSNDAQLAFPLPRRVQTIPGALMYHPPHPKL